MKNTKLVFQENQILTERGAGAIRGGDSNKPKSCSCACYYQNQGGPATAENMNANKSGYVPRPKPSSDDDIIKTWGLD